MKTRRKFLLTFFLTVSVASIFFLSNVGAQEPEAGVEELKSQIRALQKRVDELEARQQMPQRQDDSWDPFNRQGGWDPFDEIERIQEEMNRMFQSSLQRQGPGHQGVFSNSMMFNTDLDVVEKGKAYEIRFDMAGLNQEKVDIEVNEHSITIKGEHSREERQEGDDRFFRSQSYGTFMKTIPLPVDADPGKMKTEKEGDTLVITIPKTSS